MAPPNGSLQQAGGPTQLDNFNYLLQAGTQEPVEYIPVDDFFDEYLELLNFAEDGEPSPGMAKGARVEAKELPEPLTSGEGPSTDSGTGTVYGSSPPDSTSNENSGEAAAAIPTVAQSPTLMSRLESDATYTSSSPRQAAPYQPAAPPVGAPPVTSGRGIVPSGGVVTSGSVVTGQTIGGPPVISGRSAVVSGMPDQLQDRKVPQPKQRRRRVRDERQQMLNKLAQIRYRERKRSRVDTLEGEISALEAQIAELQLRQTENTDLAQQNRALEAQIEEKDAAIQQAQPGGGDKASQPPAWSPPTDPESARGALPRDCPEDLDRLVKEWLAKSREIMDLVELVGLGDGNKKAIGRLKNDVRRSVRKTFSAKTRDVLKNVEPRLSEMVSDVTTLCMRVMRLQGAQVEQLMTADYDMVCSMRGWKEEAKWLKAARELDFTPEQRKRVLAVRDNALSALHQLYGERQALNAQVLHGLQPGLFNPASGDAAATAAAKEMMRLLDTLGANLAAEQKELAHQDFVLFRQLLTPIQAGLLVSISFPDHCDALALMNAVYAVATG